MTAIVGAFAVLATVVGADGQVTSWPDSVDADTIAAAAEANVGLVPLLGAMASTHLGARDYLISVGEIDAPVLEPPPRYAAQVACIESKESGGANVWNKNGSGAGGVLQYMESTFRRGALELGHPEWSRWTPWQARLVAAHDLALGRRRQWTVSGC